MPDLDDVRRLGGASEGLVVVSLARDDNSVQSSVVNAGVLAHPVSGEAVVGFVTRGGSWKLRRLRESPGATLTFRAGWEWTAVEGSAEIAGPDDPHPGIDGDRLRVLLRDVFTAAGGAHDDFDEYDRVMAAERRVAVLVSPLRIYGSRPS